MERAIDAGRAAVIVAHGSPADPMPQEAVLKGLAARVAARLPGWTVRGATLAAPGALGTALEGLDAPIVYPFFMAEGWFTKTHLPQRLAKAGADGASITQPFGADPSLTALVDRVALQGAIDAGLDPEETTLLLAAHGSASCKTSADTAWATAFRLEPHTRFRSVVVGFVEEAPFLSDVLTALGPAVCLPFFNLRAGHVQNDIPSALAGARAPCALLPPIGEHAEVPAIIASALARSATELAA